MTKRVTALVVTFIVSISLGIAIGHFWHFPFNVIVAAKQKLSQQLSTSTEPPRHRQPNDIHEYKLPAAGAPLQLHIFNSDIGQSDNPITLILFFGGAWSRGDARQLYPQCTWLAAKGIDCISAEYRTSDSHGTSPLHAVEDSKDAYSYVLNNASKLGLGAKNVYVGGASAGGHLAASIVTAVFPEHNIKRHMPSGVILLGPVIDNSRNGYGYERVKHFGPKFSPLHNLDDQFPRTLFLVGDSDRFVPVSTAEQFVKSLDAVGVEATLKVFPNAYHSFYKDDHFNEAMLEIESFLLSDSHN